MPKARGIPKISIPSAEAIHAKIGELLKSAATNVSYYAERSAIEKAVHACAYGLLEVFPGMEEVIAFYMEGAINDLRNRKLRRMRESRGEKVERDHG